MRTILDRNRELFSLTTKISCAPLSKYKLVSPQWLGDQERKIGTPRGKCNHCDVDDEESMSRFDNRLWEVAIKRGSQVLAPPLSVMPSSKNFELINNAIYAIARNDGANLPLGANVNDE